MKTAPKVLLQRHFWLKYMDMNQGGKLILCQQEASWPPTIWQHHMFPFCKMSQQPPGSTRTAFPCKEKWRRQKNLGCSIELRKWRSNSNIKRKPECKRKLNLYRDKLCEILVLLTSNVRKKKTENQKYWQTFENVS